MASCALPFQFTYFLFLISFTFIFKFGYLKVQFKQQKYAYHTQLNIKF